MPATAGPLPPFFRALGSPALLAAARRSFDAGEIAWTIEDAGRVLGEARDGSEFEVDPARPRSDCSCSCTPRRQPPVPCLHVVAGLLDWWSGLSAVDRERVESRARTPGGLAVPPLRFEAPPDPPATPPLQAAEGSDDAEDPPPPGPFALPEPEVDPAAGALATFALLGPGLAQIRVSSDPADPLSIELELLDRAGRRTAVLRPDRTLALPILGALPQLLGESVRWAGRHAPARVNPKPARRVLEARIDDSGRVALRKAVKLPGQGRRRPVLLSGAALEAATAGGAVVHDGIVYRLEEPPLPPLPPHSVAAARDAATAGQRLLGATEVDGFLRDAVPRLHAAGLLEGDPAILDARLAETPKLDRVTIELAPDGFLLRPTFSAGELELAVEEIRAAVAGDGWIRKGTKWIRIEGDPLAELGLDGAEEADGFLRVSRWGYLRTRALLPEETTVARNAAADLFEKAIARFTPPVAVDVPNGYRGSLRPYQKEGFEWLLFLRDNGLPAILADEMGLGKTHQLMTYLLAVRERSVAEGRLAPSLVVCPRSVLDHWAEKVEEFAPALRPVVHFGPDRPELAREAAGAPLVLTTYGLLVRDREQFESVDWDSVVLDEAQRIKNVATETSRAARALRATHRVAATGTPLENRLEELRSIFEFLAPGFLGSEEDFRRRFARPIRAGDAPTLGRLRALVAPFKLRRLKRDLLADLPDKFEDLRHCALSPHQEVLYREVLEQQARPLVRDLADERRRVDYLHVFAVLTKLKRICDHPHLVLGTDRSRLLESGKFDLFREVLLEAVEGGQKVVVFSQYLEMLDLIADHLKEEGIRWVELRGQTTRRAEAVRKFQTDPECRVFLGSLLAGGVGIDLTAASVVIHYDRWWNAAREDQATDRVHRIGQTRGVQVVNLVTRGTLEESIDRMISSKRRLLETVVEPDAGSFRAFEREELIELLGGLRG